MVKEIIEKWRFDAHTKKSATLENDVSTLTKRNNI